MKKILNILHLEDSPEDAALLASRLEDENLGCKITLVSDAEHFCTGLAAEKLDLIVSDYSMPTFNGFAALEIARERRPEVPFIFLSGTIGEELAIQALKKGATDYVIKDRMARLPEVIKRALLDAENLEERKRKDAAFRAGEERFRLLLESVVDYAIVMLDPQGLIVSWNAGAQKVKGYEAREIIGKHFGIFHPADETQPGKAERELQVALAEGRFEEEGWRVRKDGIRVWADVVITPVRDENGGLRGFSKVTRDLTERKRAEEKLLESQQQMARAETFRTS